jgi:hypothetical protein
MNLDDIERILYNPFWGSQLILHFLSGCKENAIKFELIYLLFPLLLKSDSLEILSKTKSNSTIYSTFLDSYEGRKTIGGIERRINSFRILTNQSLIVAAHKKLIVIGEYIKGNTTVDYLDEKEPLIRQYFRASKYLGIIFSKSDPLDIFIKMGVREL